MSGSSPKIHAVAMPRWGMTMTEGTLVDWLVAEDQRVEAGQDLLEIETTKITNVVEAQASGVLRRQVLRRGETASVGALLGVVAEAGAPEEEIAAFIQSYRDEEAEAEAEIDAGPTARRVQTRRGAINVLSVGEGAGSPVLLVHGFGGDIAAWALNQEALGQGRAAHAFDLPAHGGSEPSAAHSPEDLADVVRAVMEALEIDRAHIVGHSLGGAAALIAAAADPKRAASLTLIAPAGLGREIDTDYLTGFIAAERRKPMQAVLSKLYSDPDKVSGQMIESVLRFKRLDGAPEALRAIAAGFTDEGGQTKDLRGALADLTVPTLVVWGEDDALIPATQADGLDGSAQVVIVPRTGHMPQVEDAAAVNRAIAGHIARAEGGA